MDTQKEAGQMAQGLKSWEGIGTEKHQKIYSGQWHDSIYVPHGFLVLWWHVLMGTEQEIWASSFCKH